MVQTRFLILLTFVICFIPGVYSQTEKGTFIIGGSSSLDVSFLNENDESGTINDNRQFMIDFSPQVGYFYAHNLMVGLSAPLSYSITEIKSNGSDQKEFIYAVAPLIRYYYGNNRFKPYLQLAYGIGKAIQETEAGFDYYQSHYNYSPYGYSPYGYSPYGYSPYGYGGYGYPQYQYNLDASENKQDINLFEIQGGFAFFISNKLSLDFGISYGELKFSEGPKDKGISSSISFNIFLGGSDE